jgi:hypothetical protein
MVSDVAFVAARIGAVAMSCCTFDLFYVISWHIFCLGKNIYLLKTIHSCDLAFQSPCLACPSLSSLVLSSPSTVLKTVTLPSSNLSQCPLVGLTYLHFFATMTLFPTLSWLSHFPVTLLQTFVSVAHHLPQHRHHQLMLRLWEAVAFTHLTLLLHILRVHFLCNRRLALMLLFTLLLRNANASLVC